MAVKVGKLAPKDKFVLLLRLYWPVEPPQPSIIDGS